MQLGVIQLLMLSSLHPEGSWVVTSRHTEAHPWRSVLSSWSGPRVSALWPILQCHCPSGSSWNKGWGSHTLCYCHLGPLSSWTELPESTSTLLSRYSWPNNSNNRKQNPPSRYFSSKDGFILDQWRIAIWDLQPWQATYKSINSKGRRIFLWKRKLGRALIKEESMAFHWLRPCQGRTSSRWAQWSLRAWERPLLVPRLHLIEVSLY